MRSHDLSKVLALCLALGAPLGGAFAQGTAHHQVSVSIPTVLRLRIDDGTTRDRASLDIAIEVAGNRVSITPGSTRVEIRANADWALDIGFRAATAGTAVPLGASLHGRTWNLQSGIARIASGTATGGWLAFGVEYGLLASLSDGMYHGTVTYTLTQP